MGWILTGWLAALLLGGLALELRRRLELAARAEHELRNPLAAIALAVEGLERAGADRARLAVLRGQIDRAGLGLDDLRAARAGRRAQPPVALVGLEGIVRSAAGAWEAPARRAGGSVQLDWRAGEVEVRADSVRVWQALGNVLDNAVEHGGGRVEVRAHRAGGVVRLEVGDDGPGFASAPGPERSAGHGRGLEVAKAAAREAGGQLTVGAGASSGASVAIELPVATRPERPGAAVASKCPVNTRAASFGVAVMGLERPPSAHPAAGGSP
ncbi:MAG: sensor histidine kinase [Thermoleophilaceae bacterium]